jgi:hypothetical protein
MGRRMAVSDAVGTIMVPLIMVGATSNKLLKERTTAIGKEE